MLAWVVMMMGLHVWGVRVMVACVKTVVISLNGANVTSAEILAKNVTFWRRVSNMTKIELCRKAGITPSHLWSIEKGKKNIRIDTLFRIAKALEIRPAFLVDNAVDGGVGIDEDVFSC